MLALLAVHSRPGCSCPLPQAAAGRYTPEPNGRHAVHERSVRHAPIILRRPCQCICALAAPSRLVPFPVSRCPGLFEELGGEVAQTLSGGTARRPALTADLA